MSVCLSVRVKQVGSHWKDFYDILCSIIFRKSVEIIQVQLKSDKDSEYVTWRRFYIYENISLNSFIA